MRIDRINRFHHGLLRPFIREGDVAVDCTAGNGHDALFLADAVGVSGRLFCFDVQPRAIRETERRLRGGGIDEGRYSLVLGSHENVADYVPAGVGAAVFNLGYLPGADRAVRTAAGTTVRAVREALSLLREEGVVSVTAYYGHRGGREEAEGLDAFASALDCRVFKVLHLRYGNLPGDPPAITIIQRAT